VEIGGTARKLVRGKTALGINAVDLGRRRIGVAAVENHGATLHVASVHPSGRLRLRCPTWTSSFDRMSTVSIPWRAKSR
jgi:hypothetical protein